MLVAASTGASKGQGGPGSGLTQCGAQSAGHLPNDPSAHCLVVAQERFTIDFDADVVLLGHQVVDQGFDDGLPRGFLSPGRCAPNAEGTGERRERLPIRDEAESRFG